METEHSSAGHACIAVGEAYGLVKAELRVQVNTLVTLLRQAGADPAALEAVAVVLHPNGAYVGGGGLYSHGAELTIGAGSGTPSRRFTSVLHMNVRTDRQPNFVLLHESGHLWAFSRGKGGKVLDTHRNIRALRVIGCAVAGICFALGILTSQLHVLVWFGFALGVFAVIMPDAVLWCLSPAEWRANRFAWRHRNCKLIGSEDDGTEHLYAPNITINQ